MDNTQLPTVAATQTPDSDKEDWMIISNFYNSNNTFDANDSNSFDWHLGRHNYSSQQIGEMPNWIRANKSNSEHSLPHVNYNIDIASFSARQELAYNLVLNHHNDHSNDTLLLIINGDAGTGKSYLINAIRSHLGKSCIICATTGKAAFNMNGVTVHSLLSLPVNHNTQKDLKGESLDRLQTKLHDVKYLLIDEYSMLGQCSFGWIDRRCRQATGKNQHYSW